MDYRGFHLNKKQYTTQTVYVAVQPRPGGGDYGDAVCFADSMVSLMRKVDRHISVIRPPLVVV